MLNFDEANAMAFISSAIFVITITLVVYGNCLMGQYLQDEAEFEKAKTLLYRASWPLRLVGIWPTDHTISSKIKFYTFIGWFTSIIIMQYSDFIMVIGDLSQMVENLSETGTQTMAFVRLLMFKFHKLVNEIMIYIQNDANDKKYPSLEEREIYIAYSTTATYFCKIFLWICTTSSIAWYLDPWQEYLQAWFSNTTVTLRTPWRVHTFFDTSSFGRTALVCIYQTPLCFTGACYASALSIIFIAVMNVCAKIAILTHKIKNVNIIDEITSKVVIRQLVKDHLELIRLGQTIDDAFNLAFLFELLIHTLLIGLISYLTILNFDEANAMTFISSAAFVFTIIIITYGNCIMGQYLQDESEKLRSAYYDSNWCEMPNMSKKALILCMTQAQIPLELTAGKFYIYSLTSFTSEEFEQSKNLLDDILRRLHWFGVWSLQRTTKSDIKCNLLITYHAIHLSMLSYDLIMVFGDLQLMVLNLIESGIQSMFMMRVLFLRFRRHLKLMIIHLKQDILNCNYKDPNERSIFVKFSSRARYYDKIFMSLGVVTTVSWYLMPLQNYILAWIFNGTMILEYPYRMFGGNQFSSVEWNIIIYIYQMPLMIFNVLYLSSYGLMMMAVNHICGHLAILSYRTTNLTIDHVISDKSNNIIRHFVNEHIKAVWLTKIIIDGFHVVLLYELIVTTVLISLISYGILLNIENVEAVEIVTLTLFVLTMLSLIYGSSVMGQFLITESENLALACCECNWYNMPISFQKSLLICLKRSQIPLQLTAGKFYVYSCSNFTNILKSSMAYVSMLRAVV
ncbi:hypothetical protein PV327_003924 [Microctonus hyperodae]|uniref:Odorant receptor n=1 Tax=Microctonus hyperodae TaxID=165561 RepID=A0AA39G514_MICHY|nr:hypothetical protein PV327_003924 [Microctonus hyperodae]